MGLMKEFWEFLKILVLFGALIVFTESSALASFIYTLF